MLAIGSRFAAWKQNAFSWKTALIVAGIIFVVFELRFAITIPTQLAWMSTNEPFHVQLLRTGIGSVVGGIIIAGGLGLLAGLGSGLAATPSRRTTELLAGLGAGFLLLWGERTVQLYPPHWHPWHAGIDGANTGIPLLGSLWLISSLVGTSLSWLRVQNALHARVRSSAVRTLVVATLGFCYGASFSHGLWIQIFLSGAFFAGGFALLEKLIARTHPSVLVAVVTAQMMGKAAADIFIPGQPDALRDSLVALVLITVVGGVLFHLMRRPTPPTVLSLPN